MHGWVRPYYATLPNGIGEIRFEYKNVQYRPLGFWGPNRNEFTFLFFALEISDRFEPETALGIAVVRRGLVVEKPARSALVRDRWHQ